jgi:hypothetical protein
MNRGRGRGPDRKPRASFLPSMPSTRDKQKKFLKIPGCLGRSPADPCLLLVGLQELRRKKERRTRARVLMAEIQI